jgi:hypothetical protein
MNDHVDHQQAPIKFGHTLSLTAFVQRCTQLPSNLRNVALRLRQSYFPRRLWTNPGSLAALPPDQSA